jgi:hypothetical protein
MDQFVQVAGQCNDELTCPGVFVRDGNIAVVQGSRITDPAVRDRLRLPAHEDAVEIPVDILLAAARQVGQT